MRRSPAASPTSRDRARSPLDGDRSARRDRGVEEAAGLISGFRRSGDASQDDMRLPIPSPEGESRSDCRPGCSMRAIRHVSGIGRLHAIGGRPPAGGGVALGGRGCTRDVRWGGLHNESGRARIARGRYQCDASRSSDVRRDPRAGPLSVTSAVAESEFCRSGDRSTSGVLWCDTGTRPRPLAG